MELSLTDTARLLGKSNRQVRYMIELGQLTARRVNTRWFIQRESIPVSLGQEQARTQRLQNAADIADEVLRARIVPKGSHYSLLDLRAFSTGRELYRDLATQYGVDHLASKALLESLMLLGCGCHEFHPDQKAADFKKSREWASRATVAILLEDVSEYSLGLRMERDFLPVLSGLIRRSEKRK